MRLFNQIKNQLLSKISKLSSSIKSKTKSTLDKIAMKIPFIKKKSPKKKAVTKFGRITPPEVWWRRWLWYMHPRRFKDWWFTKPGAIAALRILGVAAGILLLLVIGLFLYFARDLPSPGQINAQALDQTTKFYDRSGEHLLYEVYGDENRTYIDLEDISENVINATIAIEDRNFYQQGAFSSLGILRAAIYNVLDVGNGLQGGSTITQQYVKNALLTPEQTISRKVKELILSMQIEQLYDKNDILELYLNEIGYGAQAYGAQAASQMYFSKDASDITLDEAALLAALPQAPTYYSPYGQNIEALEWRMDAVLDLMAEQGYITEEEATEAQEVDTLAKINATPNSFRNIKAPHFIIRTQQQLEERYGAQTVLQGGLEIITTIDLDLQEKADKAVADGIVHVNNGGGNNAALVASDPNTGQILAMVGSHNFNQPGYGAHNAATAQRQPGSSFKPYVYAQGFESGDWGPGSTMYDVRTDFGGGYTPQNFDGGFRGVMSIRQALGESRNIPAIKMLYIVGMQETLDLVSRMGITTLGDASNYGLSLVLGSGEVQLNQHVNAYEVFANGGTHYEQSTILKVTEPNGTVLEEWELPEGEEIFDEQTTYLISSILSDDVARTPTFGANNPYFAIPGHTVAVKTGTTDDLRDGWAMGYTRDLVAGVWVGNSDNTVMRQSTHLMTGPIFSQFIRDALDGVENKPFERPSGIKSVTLDRYTGGLKSEHSEATRTDLFPSWYQTRESGGIETAIIDTISGHLATECTPERAQKEITSYGLRAEIPPEDLAFSRWNPPVAALANRLGLGSGQAIPTRTSTTHSCDDEEPNIDEFEATYNPITGIVTVTAEVVAGEFDIDSVEISYNNQVIHTCSSAGTCEVEYTPTSGGPHTFNVLVIDEGLYDATDTAQENVTPFPPSGGDDEDDEEG
ncbi:MAG: PBP1A family penicillin-binding protein [Candidatus Saccharimonadales bacterium]